MQILKKLKQKQTKTDPYYFETKVEVFYKHETVKIFQLFKRYIGLLVMTWLLVQKF